MRRHLGVTEFVIMSGPDVHDYLLTIKAQLRAYLSAAFPSYEFSLLSQDCGGMGFVVVPVVGQVGGDDPDVAEADQSVLAQIKHALEGFRPALPPTVH